MQITFLEESHIKEIINLSDVAFGKNFLTTKDVIQYVGNPKKNGLVAISKEGELAGYMLIDTLTPNKFLKLILKDKEWSKNYFKNYRNITLLKQVVVKPSFQKKGIANELIQSIQNQTASSSELFCCLAWVRNKITPLRNILLKNSFVFIKEIDNYWFDDSLTKKYNCSHCGSPPCKCSAEIYVKKKVFIS